MSDRHDDILSLIDRGLSNAQIAQQLRMNRRTIDRYVTKHGLRGCATSAPRGSVGQQGLPEEGQVSRLEVVTAERDELRRRLTKDRRIEVAEERIIAAVEEQLQQHVYSQPGWVYYEPQPPADDAHHRQVLLLSDFHGGETVDPEVLNGLNDYSWAIMEGRVDELVARVLKWKQRSPELTGLDIVFIGDMCSGANHAEIKETNELVIAEQGVRMGYLQASIIERLAPHYPEIRVGAVEGNHPRFEVKPAAKNPHNNADWIAAVIAREATKHLPNLTKYAIGKGSLFWEVAGRTAYVFHGDGIRTSMPGVPWGGVMRRTDQLSKTFRGRQLDYFWCGHFHQANFVQGGRIVMNGSLKGADEWSLKNFGSGEPPAQFLLEFDEDRERLTVPRLVTPTFGLPA